jgi:hypothetical protein
MPSFLMYLSSVTHALLTGGDGGVLTLLSIGVMMHAGSSQSNGSGHRGCVDLSTL